jgi:hypothetical protein
MADVEHSYAGEMVTLSPGHRHQSTRGIYDELNSDEKRIRVCGWLNATIRCWALPSFIKLLAIWDKTLLACMG